MTIRWIQSRRSSPVAGKLVFYLTRVKVKVRIARRVKVKYVIKAIGSCLRQQGWAKLGRGLLRTSEPLSHLSGNYVSLRWEFVDCFYIYEILGDLGDIVPMLLHNSDTHHQLDTFDVNRDKSVWNWARGEPLQLYVNFVGRWRWRRLFCGRVERNGNEWNRCFTGEFL